MGFRKMSLLPLGVLMSLQVMAQNPKNIEKLNTDKTVYEMIQYFKSKIFKEAGLLDQKTTQDSLDVWMELGSNSVFFTENEKIELSETVKNAEYRYKNNLETQVSEILKACGHTIRKEIRENNQSRSSFEEVVAWYENMGIVMKEQHKGDPDKPTVILVPQKHGKKTDPGCKSSQDSIYSLQEKLYKYDICMNFGYEGEAPTEMDLDLVQKNNITLDQWIRYESEKQWEFEENYPQAFSFGIDNSELLASARIAEDNYLLMRKIVMHKNFKKENFGMSQQYYFQNIKIYFSKTNGYEAFLVEAKKFLAQTQTITFQKHMELFFYFRDEWQQKVHNERNEEVGVITNLMAENTGNLSGYVVEVKLGGNHFKVTADHWDMSPEEAEGACLRIQEVFEKMGWSYVVVPK